MTRIDAAWLKDDATQSVFALLSDYPTYAVGGCVRDTLLGKDVKDIDLSTAAHPDDVSALAEKAGYRVVPTGIDHGTVTVLVDDVPFEITTFRHDVETDGRRAVVAFADNIEDDARRRDFTMNAIYADAKGHLLDPVEGLRDIEARRVRFIEDADRRIREDHLRSLRFFRFNAWYGDPLGGFDAEAMDAIARNLPGLETLSRERVGAEVLRLLSAPDPAPAVAAMRSTGALATVLPGADDTPLGPLVHLEQDVAVQPNGLRRLAALGGEINTLRLSRADLARVVAIQDNIGVAPHVIGYREGFGIGRDAILISAALSSRELSGDALSQVERGARAELPISARDLMPELEGKELGDALRALEQKWIDSDFTLSREDLLRQG